MAVGVRLEVSFLVSYMLNDIAWVFEGERHIVPSHGEEAALSFGDGVEGGGVVVAEPSHRSEVVHHVLRWHDGEVAI